MTETPTKKFADPDTARQSLLNLRNELISRDNDADPVIREMIYKINSCLFSQYPSYKKRSTRQA